MALIIGNDSDNRLRGTRLSDKIRGLNGNDILEGLDGTDTLLGGKDDDYLFGGLDNDVLSGDGNLTPTNQTDKGDDVLVGGSGTDILYAWGDDILVGGGPNQFNSQFIDNLKNNPFGTPIAQDQEKDTFVALNRDGINYTLTIVDFERGIDVIDLRQFGVRNVDQFEDIQNKGDYFEATTGEVRGAQMVLRININPAELTYVV